MTDRLTCWEVADADKPQPVEEGRTHICLWGGLEPAPSWDKYAKYLGPEMRPQIDAARTWLLNRDGKIPNAFDWAADHYLEFSDGRTLSFTFRAWGDFAQAVVDLREGYLCYYDGRYDMFNDEP